MKLGAGDGGTAVRRGGLVRTVARVVNEPYSVIRWVGTNLNLGSFALRCDLDMFKRPQYAYGVQQAALLAKRLGHREVSVIEFGVAGGEGLLEMERLARQAGAELDVQVNVYGFDRAHGLPAPCGYRDLPYHWRAGFFEMDVADLTSRLTDAHLVIGDLAETVPQFMADPGRAPVGFIAVDVDLYSSTVDALEIFAAPHDRLLPRVWCYLDDVVGEDHVMHNEFVGELAAVQEFNAHHGERKVCPVNGLVHKRVRHAAWCDAMFALHCFDHPDYGAYVGSPIDEQTRALRLAPRSSPPAPRDSVRDAGNGPAAPAPTP